MPMIVRRNVQRVDRTDVFVSVKCADRAIPIRHPLQRDASMQASLDPRVRAIEYIPAVDILSGIFSMDAIALVCDGGFFHLDLVEARRPCSSTDRGLIERAISELGLLPLTVTETDIGREPRATNAKIVWRHDNRRVDMDLRMQVLSFLCDEGPMRLRELLSCLRAERDPTPGLLALACADLIELDLATEPLGPATMVGPRTKSYRGESP